METIQTEKVTEYWTHRPSSRTDSEREKHFQWWLAMKEIEDTEETRRLFWRRYKPVGKTEFHRGDGTRPYTPKKYKQVVSPPRPGIDPDALQAWLKELEKNVYE